MILPNWTMGTSLRDPDALRVRLAMVHCDAGLLFDFIGTSKFEDMKQSELDKTVTANMEATNKAHLEGKIICAVISSDEAFGKLKSNPFYSKFLLKHCKIKDDLSGLAVDIAISIRVPNGNEEDGVCDELRNRGLMIWNKAYLYELAKELNQ